DSTALSALAPRQEYPSHATPPPAISALSLHDALPISALVHVCLLWFLTLAPPPPVSRPADVPLEISVVTVEVPEAPDPLPEETRSEEHTSELQSRENLVCRLLLEKKKTYRDGTSGAAT